MNVAHFLQLDAFSDQTGSRCNTEAQRITEGPVRREPNPARQPRSFKHPLRSPRMSLIEANDGQSFTPRGRCLRPRRRLWNQFSSISTCCPCPRSKEFRGYPGNDSGNRFTLRGLRHRVSFEVKSHQSCPNKLRTRTVNAIRICPGLVVRATHDYDSCPRFSGVQDSVIQ